MIAYPLQKTILQKNIASTSALPTHTLNQRAFYPYPATPKQCTHSPSDQTNKFNHAYLKNLHYEKGHIKKLSIGCQIKKQLYKKSYELKCVKFEQGLNAMNSEDERRKYISSLATKKKSPKNQAQHQRQIAADNNNFANQIKQRYSVPGIVYNQQQFQNTKKLENKGHKNEIGQLKKRRNKICKSVHHNKTQSDPYSYLRSIQNQKQQNLVTKWLSINLDSADLKKQMQTVLDVSKVGPQQYMEAQVVRDILATRIKNQVRYQFQLENNLAKIQAIMAFISASLKENLAQNAKKISLKKMNFVNLNQENKDEACYDNINSLISVKHRRMVKKERFSQSKIQDLKSQNSFQNCLNSVSKNSNTKKNSNIINIVRQERKQKTFLSNQKQQIRSVQSTKNQTCHEQKQSHIQLEYGNDINIQKQQIAVVVKEKNEIKNMFMSSKIGTKKERSSHKSHKSVIVDSLCSAQMPIIYDIDKERKKQRREKLFQQFGVQLFNNDGVKNVKAQSRKVSTKNSSKFSIGHSTQIGQISIDSKQNQSPKKHHSNYLRKRQGLYSIVMNKMENKVSQKMGMKNQLIKEDILEQQSIDSSIEKVVTSEDEEQVTSLKKLKENKDILRRSRQQISIGKLPNEDQSLAKTNIKDRQNILLYSSMLKKSVAKVARKVKRLSRAESARSSVKTLQIQAMESRKGRISKSIIRQSRLQSKKTSLFMMGTRSSRSQIEYMRNKQNRKDSNFIRGQTEYKKIRRDSNRMKSVGILRALQNSEEQQLMHRQKYVKLGINKDKIAGKEKEKGEAQNEEKIQKRRQLRQKISNLQQSFRQLLPTKMDIEGSSIFCRFVPGRRGQIELINELESIYQLKQDCELKTTYSFKEYNQDYLRMFEKDSFEVDLMRKLLGDGGMLKQTSMGSIKQPIFDVWHY